MRVTVITGFWVSPYSQCLNCFSEFLGFGALFSYRGEIVHPSNRQGEGLFKETFLNLICIVRQGCEGKKLYPNTAELKGIFLVNVWLISVMFFWIARVSISLNKLSFILYTDNLLTIITASKNIQWSINLAGFWWLATEIYLYIYKIRHINSKKPK